jgi:FG-GAP repeat
MVNNDQNEFPLPTGLENQDKRQTARHLPKFFRTTANQKFLGGTLDPLTQPGKLGRINAYVGRQDIPDYSFEDNYLQETSTLRQYYQLEPSFIYQDPKTGSVQWYADYIDYINSLRYFGAPVANHSKLNKSEAYAWNPHIDWDKIVNFREYYWLPTGPDPITIYGHLETTTSTYSITEQNEGDHVAYVFSPDGLTINPRLTLYRGITYNFDINTPNKSLLIKTSPTVGNDDLYSLGINKQGISSGTMTFTVPYDAPNLLYYIDANDPNSYGMIDIKDITADSTLDVEAEIVGKKYYTSSSGISFINGLKIQFVGQITPEKYIGTSWYVEGVGSAIKLISVSDLESPAIYGTAQDFPFDEQPFDSIPLESATSFPGQKDYITINRASRDFNSWSRTNRWFHIKVLETTAAANNQIAVQDQNARAIRPIIEFEPNLKLFNHGINHKKDIDLVDTFTTDVFSTIEGSIGYFIDGEALLPNYRVLFLADKDTMVYGKIYQVNFIFNANENRTQITLIETDDSIPNEGDNVYITKGTSAGSSYYFSDGNWYLAQKKISVNQAPLFDLFDEDAVSFGDNTKYPKSTFSGNRIFGYRIGKGIADTELGFPISYANINNVGDIQFQFDLQTSSWTYQDNSILSTVQSYSGFLKIINVDGTYSYSNGWIQTNKKIDQNVVRVLRITAATDLVPIDVFDNSGSLNDLTVRVYVNNIRRIDISPKIINGITYIKFATPLSIDDKVVYKVKSKANKNNKGYYEIPSNWQNNSLNQLLSYFTLGEITDHTNTIVENIPNFVGSFPGVSNLSNIGNVSYYGRKFLQHAGPMSLSAFLLVDQHANIAKSLKWNANKYSVFKKEFVKMIETTAYDGSIAEIVDSMLLKWAEAKNINVSSFYFSDMVPYGPVQSRNYTVVDPNLPAFVIDSIFDPKTQTKRSVLVYLNEQQLIYDIDYYFDTENPFVKIKVPLKVNDVITIRDYASTDACYIPFTPTKLGLYPSYVPRKYIDDTYINPIEVIQGHDGSIIKAYGDFRDDLILELEKRIFNGIRVDYDPTIYNIDDIVGGYYRKGDFTKAEVNNILSREFLRWVLPLNQDFNNNNYYIEDNGFTFNYNNSPTPNGTEKMYGYWRGIYKYFYDTDRPHTCPWEMQGFTIKPKWWDGIYGKAPYTSENKIMWDAIEQGLINDPLNKRYDSKYARPGLSKYIPVDDSGNLLSPLDSNLIQSFSLINAQGNYIFGDQAPVETAWRRSSEYPYAIMIVLSLLNGSEFLAKCWDRFRIKRNIAGQIYYTETSNKVSPESLIFSDVPLSDGNDPSVLRTYTNGLANIVDEFVGSEKGINIDQYKIFLSNIQTKLSHRMGGFSSKDNLKILIDSRSLTASGSIYLPYENYNLFYNKSAPVDTVTYSGVIVEKRNNGFSIRGYDNEKSYFEIYPAQTSQSDPSINIGGVSENFYEWTPGSYYAVGQIVQVSEKYYRAIVGNTASAQFATDIQKWAPLSSLPIVGGVSAIFRTKFSSEITRINYGTIFSDIQSVVDFLLSYQERLKDLGFSFDDFSQELQVALDWQTSAKEFMFWSIQKWSDGSVITLSPSAGGVKFSPKINAIADDLTSDFYDYGIFRSDGTLIKSNQSNIFRTDGGFIVKPLASNIDGIFFVRATLVYKEHVLILDNISQFNDVIFDTAPGYRQGRVRLVGFKTIQWDGGYTSPGFIYDEALIQDWQSNTDYNLGDVVNYKGYYFTALYNVSGSLNFDYNYWKKLTTSPTPKLIANFDYQAEQFRDFYNLDASVYDSNQQALARHLVGYQDRPYLDNIIIDDVSQYKFYLGYIKEKGTQNSITKLFNALRDAGYSSAEVMEEWAFKVGDYGAIDAYNEIEIILDESKIRSNPQNIVLTQTSQQFNDLTIYNVTSNMVSIKPSSYDSKPFKTTNLDTSLDDYGVFKYKVAGYVKEEQIDHIVYDYTTLLNFDLTLLKEKDKIWVGNTPNNDWTVLEYQRTGIIIVNWSISINTLSLVCDKIPNSIKANDIIAIINLDVLNGLYTVLNVYNNTIEVFTYNSNVYKLPETLTSGLIFKLEPVRFADESKISLSKYNTTDIRGKTIWLDKDSAGKWAVLQNVNAFSENTLTPFATSSIDKQQFGSEIKISGNGQWMFVSAIDNNSGKVFVYHKPSRGNWQLKQQISMPTDVVYPTNNEQFGSSIDVNYDGSLLVISAPYSSNLLTTVSNGMFIGSAVGTSSGLTNQGVVHVFSFNTFNLIYEKEITISSHAPTSNEKFGSKVKLGYDGINTWLFVASKNYNSDQGRVHIFKKTNGIWDPNVSQNYLDFSHSSISYPSGSLNPFTSTGNMYGYDISCTDTVDRIVVSAPFLGDGSVFVFTRAGFLFSLVQVIDSYTLSTYTADNLLGSVSFLKANDLFGYSVIIRDDLLFIGSPNNDTGDTNLGAVYVFDTIISNSLVNYRLRQMISPPVITNNERFGTKISINPDGNILAISAIGGNTILDTTFDTYSSRLIFDQAQPKNYELDTNSTKNAMSTTFDGNSTKFYDKTLYSGTVYVYNRLSNDFIYGDKLDSDQKLSANDNFGYSIAVSNNNISVGSPGRFIGKYQYGTVFNFTYDYPSWEVIATESNVVDISKFKKAFIYNTETKKLIESLDFLDPAKGRIPGIADQEITYQTFYDPAIYQYTSITDMAIDTSQIWTDDHVGEVWWDLSTVKFMWYEQGDSTYRTNNWGRIFPGSSIDIYEWVESVYLPSAYTKLADTTDGLSQGISGIPKDISDFTYSTKIKYDRISGVQTTLYYFWVKNKVIVPNVNFRNLSISNVSKLILDPTSYGYPYVMITDKNSFAITNVKNKLLQTDVSINLQFYTIDNTDLMIHREYALIAKEDPYAIIPKNLETKWFDSLTGYTINGWSVPDYKLNPKQRYGTLESPRQSWFVNRFEALKQLIEYVNSVLIVNQITNQTSFKNLNSKELPPTIVSGDIDTIIDVNYQLKFVGTQQLEQAVLSAKIVDGKFITVSIVDPGYGYGRNKPYAYDDYGNPINWYGPNVEILGTGTGAKIQTVINGQGKIIQTIIVKPGSDYDDNNTVITVRSYCVLINNDSDANNGWSVQSWNADRKEWIRIKTQSYDVTKYWSYADWYKSGYGLDSDISLFVDNIFDVYTLDAYIGAIIKVKDGGNGKWLLMLKTSNNDSTNLLNNYEIVGEENGTIQLSSSLYNPSQGSGFDYISSFDTGLFDQSATTELRIILQALKEDVLINDLRIEYIRAFFNSVHYVFSEQLYVDWAFKTSFLKVNNIVGTLKQRPVLQDDVLDSYQSYIEEVKPYKSNIREFVSIYGQKDQPLDYANEMISDFDLPPYYDPSVGKTSQITAQSSITNYYPWKNWLENHTYSLAEIVLYDNGSKYTTLPQVIISGGDGINASATAYISQGSVYKIVIDNPGINFTSAPQIYLSGGNGDIDEFRAKAYAIIGNGLVRNNLIGIKFDRNSLNYEADSFKFTDRFSGDGFTTKYKLTYAPEIEKSKFYVLVDDLVLYGNQFTVSIVETLHDTYKALEGYISFAIPPSDNPNNIIITYHKNINIYSAADRIDYAYNPTEGRYGKSLGLLMTGIDYGGVQISTLDFEMSGGWDILPWNGFSWDSVPDSNDDSIFKISTPSGSSSNITATGSNSQYTITVSSSTGLVEGMAVSGTGINPFAKITIGGINGDVITLSAANIGTVSGTVTFASIFTLGFTPNLNDILNVYVNNLRIDDPNYGTSSQTNKNAKMLSIIADGTTSIVTVPSTVPLSSGDLITFRKSTSDGSILLTDLSVLDSFLDGGDSNYSTALGINADEIVIDGDGFITTDTSHGPEELIQGQVVDTVDIKVYHAPSSGGPKITINNIVGDGIQTVFPITSVPGTKDGLIVIEDNIIADVEINYLASTITFSQAPLPNSKISAISIDTAGYDMLDKEIYVGDGTTTNFLTAVKYSKTNNVLDCTAFVTIDGIPVDYSIIESDSSYTSAGRIVISFDNAPDVDSVIQILVFSGTIQKYSQVNTQSIPIVQGQLRYDLNPIPSSIGPLETMVFVAADSDFLQAPECKDFSYDGNSLIITDPRYSGINLTINDLDVYKNGLKLIPNVDYTVDSTQNTITMNKSSVDLGDDLTLVLYVFADYRIISNQIVLSSNNYSTSNKIYLNVTTFTNHDILKIKSTEEGFYFNVGFDNSQYDIIGYDTKSSIINDSGIFDLPREVNDISGVFVSLNRKLLKPNYDYVVLDNKRQIKLQLPDNLKAADYIEIISFNPDTVTPSFGFKQFKDMTNRMIYKRLDGAKSTVLAQDFSWYDTFIEVKDASVLELPNPSKNLPGVVEINNERIEYFSRLGNTLGQLRRGTLGTGINHIVPAGTLVSDIGIMETIPYRDSEKKYTFYGDGINKFFAIDFVPSLNPNSVCYTVTANGTNGLNYIVVSDASALAIGMFLISENGIQDGTVITSILGNTIGISKKLTNNVTNSTVYISNWYRKTIQNTYGQNDQLEVFVGGSRLSKVPVNVYDKNLGQDSYLGAADVMIEAEFSVNGTDSGIMLTNPPAAGELIVIICKTGKLWQDIKENSPLVYSKSDIAKFLTATSVSLPK